MLTERQERRQEVHSERHGNLATYRAWMRWCGGAGDEQPPRRRTAVAVLAGLGAGALIGLATTIIHGLALVAVVLCLAGAGALIAVALVGRAP